VYCCHLPNFGDSFSFFVLVRLGLVISDKSVFFFVPGFLSVFYSAFCELCFSVSWLVLGRTSFVKRFISIIDVDVASSWLCAELDKGTVMCPSK